MINRAMKFTVAAVLGLAMAFTYVGTAGAWGGRGGAGGIGARGGGMLDRLDTDGDGKVSRAEYDAHFAQLDQDGDGYITTDEYQNVRNEFRTERRNQMFEADDENKDGKVSRDEFSGPSKAFSKIDADGDGYITGEEAQNFRPLRDGSCRSGRGGQRGPGGPGGPGMGN